VTAESTSSRSPDKVVSIDIVGMKVTYRETQGVQGGKAVKYAFFRLVGRTGGLARRRGPMRLR